jgi:hypothetical protein
MTIDFNSFQNNNTVSGQTAQSFSSTVKNLASSVSSGVSGALNTLSSKLGISGLSGGGSISGAFNTLGSTNIVGELKDNLGVAPPIGGKLPQAMASKTSPPPVETYPLDLGKYFIQITFKDEYQANPIVQRQSRPTFTVNLPIPENLQETFSMNYNPKELGLATGALTDMLTKDDTLSKLGGDTKSATAAAEGLGRKAGEALKQATSGQGLYTMGRYMVKNLGMEDIGNAFDRVTGTILNPYQELQFEGVSLRDHTFSYTFSPNSLEEAETLKRIIREMKVRMHPSLNGLLMNFPDRCSITVSQGLNDKAYYTFQDCYLKSMVVNYAPSGAPAFTKGGLHPTEIRLDLTFGEVKPITRDFFEGV